MAKSRSRRQRRLAILIAGLVCSLAMAMVVLFPGHVSGIEFAPSHFEARRFQFYELPLLQLQITPIR
ncbi:MAG: hypothetical protein AAGA03_10340, partial [Planctomycetota bacterium]